MSNTMPYTINNIDTYINQLRYTLANAVLLQKANEHNPSMHKAIQQNIDVFGQQLDIALAYQEAQQSQ